MMSAREDCFGYNKERRECRALTELVCKNKECKFYKTQQQYEDGIKMLEGLEAFRESEVSGNGNKSRSNK